VPSIAATHGVNLVIVAARLETEKSCREAQHESDAAFHSHVRDMLPFAAPLFWNVWLDKQ
jgi:hypothetical protein